MKDTAGNGSVEVLKIDAHALSSILTLYWSTETVFFFIENDLTFLPQMALGGLDLVSLFWSTDSTKYENVVFHL